MDSFLKSMTFSFFLSALVYALYASATELSEFVWSDDEVSGIYKNEDGSLGIKFMCRPKQLEIETLSHITMLRLSSLHEVDKRMARSIYILDGEYLQHEHAIHRHLDRSVGDTTRPFNETINDLLHMEEITLLEGASREVGEQGVTGKNTPMLLPFHMFALKMTQLLDKSSQNFVTNEQTKESVLSRKKRRYDCKKYENYRNCKGLCGPRCTCWRQVCGDCCFHRGCFDHDVCCARHGYLSVECVNFRLFSFECDKPYYC